MKKALGGEANTVRWLQ